MLSVIFPPSGPNRAASLGKNLVNTIGGNERMIGLLGPRLEMKRSEFCPWDLGGRSYCWE